MAESVDTKSNPQTQIRQLHQLQAKKKQQLMEQQKADLKSLKDQYAAKNKAIENESEAVINHIKGASNLDEDSDSNKETSQKPTVYNRRAQASQIVKNAESKGSDEFYKVQDRGSKITNKSDSYVIDAYAPEHEKDNIRVSVQNDKVVIAGQRKHSGEADQGIKKISTNNFQTFREEFKFDKPVSHEGMTRERIGDYIRFTIPKLESVPTKKEAEA